MAFKLGKEKRGYRTFKEPMVFRKEMDDGSLAQANMDGTIDIDPSIPVGSKKYNKVLKHEMKHQEDLETGRAAYGEDWVMWDENIYLRKTIDGVKVIDGPNGRWPEGDENHPWEQEAIQAEKE